jgi:3-O-methylgallate 3,4-dioxygenase
MARIVAAFGTSHSTMLFSSVEHWQAMFDHVDRKAPIRDFAGATRSFDELLLSLPEDAAERIAPAAMARRHRATMAAMDRLQADIAAAKLDALVIVGDDQREIFQDDSRPAIAIYCGPTIRNAAAPQPPPADWYERDQHRRLEDGRDAQYPVHEALAVHVITGLTEGGFDVTAVKSQAAEKYEGHAYSFVIAATSRMRRCRSCRSSSTPITRRTSRRRSAASLSARRRIVEGSPGDLRVGILASGGLSHFLVNEALDRQVIAAIRNRDAAALTALPPLLLNSGSSEIRNWICVVAAATDMRLDWLEYVPAYRSHALTGVGLCFAHWS